MMTNGQKVGYKEFGSSGIESSQGFISEAYHANLTWPTVQPLFSRIRRSDSEMSTVRIVFLTLARGLELKFTAGQEYAEDQEMQEAIEFGNEVLEDLEGGPVAFIETLISHVPFFGWGWWEAVPGLRDPNWNPPDPNDPWRSKYDDKKVGFRRFAWRDSSSFAKWSMDDNTGRLFGMVQRDYPNTEITIPLDQSIHIVYGDSNNPEGLSPLEAVYRLERIKFGLEVIQGIGFEHAAGFLKINASKALTDSDKAAIKKIARAVLTAQEGNYLSFPKDLDGEFIDSGFQAASSILEAIRYYGIVKLMVFMCQWIALSSISGSGSYSAMDVASEMFVTFFNAMMAGFIEQVDKQVGERIYNEYNDYSSLPERPKLTITEADKNMKLDELAKFLQVFMTASDLYEEDIEAIRQRSGFLPVQPAGEIARARSESQQEEAEAMAVLSQHEPETVDHVCPECGNSQALKYKDHKGLHVCTRCLKTYDPEVE